VQNGLLVDGGFQQLDGEFLGGEVFGRLQDDRHRGFPGWPRTLRRNSPGRPRRGRPGPCGAGGIRCWNTPIPALVRTAGRARKPAAGTPYQARAWMATCGRRRDRQGSARSRVFRCCAAGAGARRQRTGRSSPSTEPAAASRSTAPSAASSKNAAEITRLATTQAGDGSGSSAV
jgi:hypothetical protein